jgi:GxxExxY protein
MPIALQSELRRISQEQFGQIAYDVMDAIFAVHNELGRFLEEDIYRTAIAGRLDNVQAGFAVKVEFDSFAKPYYLDLVVDQAACFELKTVERLIGRHRAQLLNYLQLVDLEHGKLVNLRPDLVEHEFVNATRTRAERTSFEVIDSSWNAPVQRDLLPWLTAALRDWGTGLDLSLYEDAATHFYGGPEHVLGLTEVRDGRRLIGCQPVRLAAPDIAFKITVMQPKTYATFEDHARRFLAHSSLAALQWINITQGQVLFKTLGRD